MSFAFVGITKLVQREIQNLEREADEALERVKNADELRGFEIAYLGRKGKIAALFAAMAALPVDDRRTVAPALSALKKKLEDAVAERRSEYERNAAPAFDVTLPGIRPQLGHLHIVSQAIAEIEDIFARINFIRVRHPEVDTDWYAFESLNMPKEHPARDDWETFFIQTSKQTNIQADSDQPKIVLTPHTSNGQVREMEKGRLPIRMINIAKCYRRQADVSHAPMFHQFEGLYVDTHVTIAHLKGVMDYFFKQFFGEDRVSRLRPHHFQFTEPSFEIDVSCGLCHGNGCRLCKDGWLELGGAGMVHPNVLKAGGIDPSVYSGFAFGWGVERVYMMKEGLKVDDIRILYRNDVRFLEQF